MPRATDALDTSPAPAGPIVSLLGFSAAQVAALRNLLADLTVQELTLVDLPALAGLGVPSVLALGPALAPPDARELLLRLMRADPRGLVVSIVLQAGAEPEIFQPLVDHDRLFFLTNQLPDLKDVAGILRGARRKADRLDATAADLPDDEEQGRLLELYRRLVAELEIGGALSLIEREARLLGEAESAVIWIFREDREVVATVGLDGEWRQASAAAGLTSFVARTGQPVLREKVGDDPRFDPDLDGEAPNDHFLALPILADVPGKGAVETGRAEPGKVLAVIALRRKPEQAPFSAEDLRRLEGLANYAAPGLGRLLVQDTLERQAGSRNSAMRDGMEGVFRGEALEVYERGLPEEGHVLEIAPAWMHRAYGVLIALLLCALIFSLIFRIDEYAQGLGVVRTRGRVDVTTPVAGTVSAIEVKGGQDVAAGQLLLRLYGAQEAAELARVRREFELGLLDRLRRPADRLAAQRLGELRAAMQLAAARLEQRSVRAPAAGKIGDIRVEVGQLLGPGEVIVSLGSGSEDRHLLAILPGQYRPQLRPGMPLRLELFGYRYAYQELEIATISEKVFGPSEARRFLGPGGSDLLALDGPVLVIEATLPGNSFESDGRRYEYHDGISGRVDIRVRSQRVLFVLIPALQYFFEGRDGRA